MSIPFKANKLEQIGQSRIIAESSFLRIERRFLSNEPVWRQYLEFMQEYESLKHTSLLSEPLSGRGVYLPHHPIIRELSQITKLRVVFNASCKTSSGLSLNDCMHSGPALQAD